MTFIYLDDDQDDLEHFRLAAEAVEGIKKVYTTSDAASFFDLLKKNLAKGTVAFLDINMPVKSGFQVLKEIREKKEYDSVIVVMHSTASDSVTVSISRELGANYYSSKPDNLKQLRGLMGLVIDNFGKDNEKEIFFLKV